MSYIDKKINTYYNLYSTRMMMVISDNTNLEHELNRLLMRLKDMESKERETALERLGQTHRLQSVGFISRKSFARRKKANPNEKNVGILEEELSLDEKRRLTQELLTEAPDRYSIEKVRQYFDAMPFYQDRLSVGEYTIETREDAMMVAAAVIYSGTAGFPYEAEFGRGMVETEIASISNITIKRKKQ